MTEPEAATLDPRIVRTRHLLQDSLSKLLKQKSFEEISVQDIADAATVNRATFYDHYQDKFALLRCMVGRRFHEMLAERQVAFDGTCRTELKPAVVAVCDYVLDLMGPAGDRKIEPHMESAIIGVLQWMFTCDEGGRSRELAKPGDMAAAAAAWAIYGAARQWAQQENHSPSAEIAEAIAEMVGPMLHRPQVEKRPGR